VTRVQEGAGLIDASLCFGRRIKRADDDYRRRGSSCTRFWPDGRVRFRLFEI
jgi:hypothetical protein